MGVFGNLDIDKIPADPNFVEKGFYPAQTTKFERLQDNRDQSWSLRVTVVIDKPDSKYHGFYPNKWLTLHENFDANVDQETPEILKDNSRLKKALKVFGVTREQMDEFTIQQMIDKEILTKGIPCVIYINNYESKEDGELRSSINDFFPPDHKSQRQETTE